MKELSFTTTKTEDDLISSIVERAKVQDRLSLTMDLTACHSNGCPLDFAKLLGFDNFNFSHDIGGIRRHMNRTTGQLENCFVPRCAKNQ